MTRPVPAEQLQHVHGRYRRGDAEQDLGPAVLALDGDGEAAQQDAPGVEQQHTLALREAVDQHEVVVHVVLARGVERHAAPPAAPDDEGQVDERHAQHQQRQHEGDGRRALHHALYAQTGEHEPQEHGPGVPHEDAGRVEVEAQKGEGGAGENGGDDAGGREVRAQRDDAEGERGDAADPGGKTVEPVDEVHHVDDHRHPEGRDENGDDGREIPHHVGEGDAHAGDADVEVNGHADGQQLADELDDGFELVEVVEEPYGHYDCGAADDAPHGPVDLDEDHDRDHPAEVDTEAAEERRGQLVHAAVVGGCVHSAGAVRETPHERREHVDECCRDEKAQDRSTHRAVEEERPVYGSVSWSTETPASASISRESPSGYPSR